MDRRSAVRYLHARHPQVIEAPKPDVDVGALHLEVFWLQTHACDLIDQRADRAVRRCFATIYRLLVQGDGDVQPSVYNHFLIPHLVLHEDLAWAQERMPRLLSELCGIVREAIRSGAGSAEGGAPP